MTITLKNGDGEEVEVMTQEEIDAQTATKIEEAKKEAIASYEAEKAELNKKLTEAEEALAKGGDKEFNFGQLRKQVETLKTSKEELEKTFTGELTSLKNSLKEEKVAKAINSFANGDSELEKKIRFHYEKSLTGIEDINERAAAAAKLSGIGESGNSGSGFISSSGAGNGRAKPLGKLTADQVDLASKLGATENDIKKVNK